MSELLKAQELVEQNRFEEALEIFQNLSQSEQLSFEERSSSFEFQIEIFSTLEKSEEKLRVQKQYFQILWSTKKYEKALRLIESIIQSEKQASLTDVYYLWFCLVQNGEIDRASKLGQRYLEALFQKKNFQKGLQFADEFEQKLALREVALYYRLSFLVLKGDKSGIEQLVAQNRELIISSSKNHELKKAKQLILKLKDFETYPQVSKVSFELSLELFELAPVDELVFYGKDFIHRVFDYLLYSPFDCELFAVMLRYSQKAQSRLIIEALIRVIEKQPQLIRGQRKLMKAFEDAKVDRASWPEIKEEPAREDDFDLGEDLLNNPAVNGQTLMIRRLEHDIAILKKKNLNEEAKVILKKLKELDPTHPLVTREERKKIAEDKPILLKELLELGENQSSKEQIEDRVMLTSFKKHLAYLDRQTLIENFRDIAVSLLTFNAPELAISLLEDLRGEFKTDEQLEKKLNLEYLLITCLEKAERHFDAMIVLDEVLNLAPLLDEERKVFLYQKGDLAKKMGQKLVALSAFKAVKQIDPGYRLVQERIRELAKG